MTMFARILPLVSAGLLAFQATPSLADWDAMDPARGYGQGAAGCSTDPYNTTCLALRCTAGAAPSLALIGTGGDFGTGRQMPVFLRVDGGRLHQVVMQPVSTRGALEATVPFDAVAHAALIEDLRRGNGLAVSLWQDETQRQTPSISLVGATRALEQAFDVCGINAAQGSYGSAEVTDWTAPAIDPTATPRWSTFSGLRTGASYCPVLDTFGGNTACVNVGCVPGQAMELDIVLAGTVGGLPTAGMTWVEAQVSVDGRPEQVIRLERDLQERQANVYRARLTEAEHLPLLQALSRGNAAGIVLTGSRGQGALGLGLAGSSKTIAAAQQACPFEAGYTGGLAAGHGSGTQSALIAAVLGQAPNQTTSTTPYNGERPGRVATLRFVPLFDGRRERRMEDAAQRLMAAEIASIGANVQVIATSLPMSSGRTLLSVVLGPSTEMYGISGTGTVIWLLDNTTEVKVFEEPGVAIWADQENVNGGMPDLWVQAMQGLDQPFTLWRWNGAAYVFADSIAP